MHSLPETKENKIERRFTPESAQRFLERYRQIQEKSKLLEGYYEEIARDYPDLVGAEDVFLQNQEETKDESEIELVTPVTEEIEEVPPVEQPVVVQNPIVQQARFATQVAVPVVAPSPVKVENQETADPAILARAKEVADKIKHHPTTMTQEDWEFERNPKNRELIDDVLEAMATPAVAPDESKMMYPGKPSLEASRRDFSKTLEKNHQQINDGTIDVMNEAYVNHLQGQYDENHLNEYKNIYETEGRGAALRFALKEQAIFTKERIKGMTARQQERIGNIMNKAAGYGFIGGVLAFAALEKGFGAVKNKIQNVDWRKKMANFGKSDYKPRSTTEMLRAWIGMKPGDEKLRAEQEKKQQKEAKEAADAAQKAAQEKAKAQPKTMVEAEPGLEFKKSEYIAAIMGVERLDGEYRAKWNKVKEAPAMAFLYPYSKGAKWSEELKGKIARREVDPLSKYPDYAKKIHADLLKYVEDKKVSSDDLKKMKLNDLVGRMVSDGIAAPKSASIAPMESSNLQAAA